MDRLVGYMELKQGKATRIPFDIALGNRYNIFGFFFLNIILLFKYSILLPYLLDTPVIPTDYFYNKIIIKKYIILII